MRCFCGAMAEPKSSMCYRCEKAIKETIDGYDERSFEDEAAMRNVIPTMMKPGYKGYTDLDWYDVSDGGPPWHEEELPKAHGSAGVAAVAAPKTVKTPEKVSAVAAEDVKVKTG